MEKKPATFHQENFLNEFKLQTHTCDDNSFFLTCYDPINDDIFFTDFVTEKVILGPSKKEILHIKEGIN